MCWRRWCVLISSANGCPRSFRVDLRLTEKLLFSGFTVISGMLGEQQGGSLGWRGEPCHLRESEQAERGPPLLATPTQPAVPRFWSIEFHKFSCYPWPILLCHWFFHPLVLPWVFSQWISFDTTLREMCLDFHHCSKLIFSFLVYHPLYSHSSVIPPPSSHYRSY